MTLSIKFWELSCPYNIIISNILYQTYLTQNLYLDPLPIGFEQEELIFNLDTDYPLPPLSEYPDGDDGEPELCPWANISSGKNAIKV